MPGTLLEEGEVLRFDRHNLPGTVAKNEDGFIEADPIVTRTGVFCYKMGDGSIRRELRCDEEVFAEDSLKTARMIPITNRHPSAFVRPDNAKALAVGWTGENVRKDGASVRVPIKITVDEGIKAVEDGRRQLSLGYKCLVEREDGEFNGEKYTHIQRRIRYNHLALCKVARAGAQATLRLDALDAVMVDEEEAKEKKKERKGTGPMPGKVRLDNNCEYEVPAEVEAAFAKHKDELGGVAEKRDELQSELDKLQAKHDALEKDKKELEKQDSSEEISKAVKSRMALVTSATKILGEEEAKKFDDMSDNEIRVAAIKADDEGFDEADKSDDYLSARFDNLKVEAKKSDSNKTKQGKKVVGDGSGHEDADDMDPDKAREKMIARQDGTDKKGKDKKD